jgi:parallel beta-helix repeat protein
MVLGGTARGIRQGESIVTLKIDSLLATRKARTGKLGIRFAIALLAVLAFSLSVRAQASDIYITPDGSPQGACTSNVQTPAFFNNSANWGTAASKIGNGTTVHLCGTFTSSKAGDTLLTFQGSGSSGSPITLLFDTNTTLTNSAYWGSNGAVYIPNGKSWIVVDGAGTGIIENTGNGTGLNNGASNGINNGNVDHVTIKNLTIQNIYVYTSSSDGSSNLNSCGCVAFNGSTTNSTVTGNTVHHCYGGVWIQGSSSDINNVVSNNTISNTNWGIGHGGATKGIVITGNDISHASFEDANDNYHHNGIMMFPQGVLAQGVVISNNYIHDIGGHETAHIFLDPAGSGDLPGVLIYNNVVATLSGNGPANAFITVGIGVSGSRVFNNTISGSGGQGISGQISPTLQNNIITATYCGICLNGGAAGVVSNYNDISNLTGGSIQMNDGTHGYGSLAAWSAGTKQDENSITANPILTSTFGLNSGSGAIGKGANLTFLGISGLNIGAPQFFGTKYSCGVGCVQRPSNGGWDMGAYQSSGSGSAQSPAPPSSLNAQVQ